MTTLEARKPLDVSKLTLGEIAKLEDLSGLPMARIADMENSPQGKLLAAMVFVTERRHGNAIAWPDCLDMGMTEAMERLGMADQLPAEDQAEAPAEAPAEPQPELAPEYAEDAEDAAEAPVSLDGVSSSGFYRA